MTARCSDHGLRWIARRAIHRGIAAPGANEQSTAVQNSGMPRIGPQITASGMIAAQQIKPKSTIQAFRTGSRIAPAKSTASMMWANASQSIKGDSAPRTVLK